MPPTRRPVDQIRPSSAYRRGERGGAYLDEHNRQSRQWRRGLTLAEFDAATTAALLAAIRETGDPKEAAEIVGLTSHRVWGRTVWDEGFTAALEEALAESCRGGDRCGTERGYRQGGRCADCRAAKRATRD